MSKSTQLGDGPTRAEYENKGLNVDDGDYDSALIGTPRNTASCLSYSD